MMCDVGYELGGLTSGSKCMTTYCAVARYVVGSTDRQKRRDLLDGLDRVIYELAELGVSRDAIEDACECALADCDTDKFWGSDD